MARAESIGSVAIWERDFRDVGHAINTRPFDLIYTDPPYPKEYLSLYNDLAAFAADTLKPGGSLLAVVPHYALPAVLANVEASSFKNLRYRWTMAMWQEAGPHPRMAMGVEILWKPIVWWTLGPYPQKRGFVVDGFINVPKDAGSHRWEQSPSWAEYGLKFCPAGGVTCDPMMGTGTFIAACQSASIRAIGIEKDQKMYDLAREKLGLTDSPAAGV